jgi:thiol:disulfide interchange protein
MRSLVLLALGVVLGCGSDRSSGTAAPTLLADHIAAAGRAREPVVVELGAAWCKPCHDFAEHVLPDPRVQAALHGVDFVEYDIDTPAGADAMKRCNVAAIPAVVGLARDGTPQVLVAGAEPTVDQLVAFLTRVKQDAAAP